MSNNYKETWFVVPSYILDLPGLTLGYLKVYETIFQFLNKNLPCYLNNETIASRTNLEIRQVQYAIEFFEKAGELLRITKGKKRYITRQIRLVEIDSTENVQACTTVHPMHAPQCTHNIKNINKTFSEDKPLEKASPTQTKNENSLSIFLPDKYLALQNKLNQQCLKDRKCNELFNNKFKKVDVTIEEMLEECVMYYAMKPNSQNVSPHRFLAWIKRENVELYDKKPDSVAYKLWRDLNDVEKTLISEYKHFQKYPLLKNNLSEEKKRAAQELIQLLQSTQNMRAI